MNPIQHLWWSFCKNSQRLSQKGSILYVWLGSKYTFGKTQYFIKYVNRLLLFSVYLTYSLPENLKNNQQKDIFQRNSSTSCAKQHLHERLTIETTIFSNRCLIIDKWTFWHYFIGWTDVVSIIYWTTCNWIRN